MTYRTKTIEQTSPSRVGCAHYWVIEQARGPKSRGVCKFCREEREFLNSVPESVIMGRHHRVFEMPELPDVEIEKGSN